ncbi:hypothetical protein QE152_g1510 [Popillia japonica]|uniref:Uncharacterized protein n=1 Tax=Popillia japonica TaxID=7064 RepID=A0AAW1N6X8_POPJA
MKLTGIQTLEVPKSEAHNGEIKTESFAVTNKHSILNIMAGSSNQSSTIKHAIENIIKIDTSINNSETNKRIELGQSFKEAQAGSEQVPNLDANSGDNPIKLELEEPARQNPQMKSMGIQRNDPEVVENLKKSFDKSKMIKSIMVSAQNLSAPSSGGTE